MLYYNDSARLMQTCRGVAVMPATDSGEPSMYRHVALFLLSLPVLVEAGPLVVFTGVPPLQAIIEELGGRHVVARSLVRPGHDPHIYEPTPRQIAALAEARLYVRAGVPFEDAWMARLSAANPRMRWLDALGGKGSGRAAERGGGDHDHDNHHPPHEVDPHVWTSPPRVRALAAVIWRQLVELDPEHAGDYGRSYDDFVRRLDALHDEIRGLLEPLHGRSFMVFHPAWGHFAETYGLVQVSIEHDGKAPGARALAELIEEARRDGIRVVFVQPQFDRRQAAEVARAIGGRVTPADPLAYDFVGNLRHVAREFAQAMRP